MTGTYLYMTNTVTTKVNAKTHSIEYQLQLHPIYTILLAFHRMYDLMLCN